MRKNAFTTLFIAALVVAVAFAIVPALQEAALYRALTKAPRMYRIGYASHIALTEFTDFEWETVHIFVPYTDDATILRTLGINWSGARNNRLYDSDSYALLVFVKDGAVVRSVYLPRNEADYASIADRSPFTPETANFFLPQENSPQMQVLR